MSIEKGRHCFFIREHSEVENGEWEVKIIGSRSEYFTDEQVEREVAMYNREYGSPYNNYDYIHVSRQEYEETRF